MAKVEAIMTGHRKTDRRLKKLRGPEAKKMIRKASKDAIKPIQQEAKSSAKQGKKTGILTKGYKARSMPRSRVYQGAPARSATNPFGVSMLPARGPMMTGIPSPEAGQG